MSVFVRIATSRLEDELKPTAGIAALQENREAAKAGLEAARLRRSRREDFERDKEALLEYHARLVPEDLDGLASEQRRTLYRMMRLKVLWPATESSLWPIGVVMPHRHLLIVPKLLRPLSRSVHC
jgi:hypothetical protein